MIAIAYLFIFFYIGGAYNLCHLADIDTCLNPDNKCTYFSWNDQGNQCTNTCYMAPKQDCHASFCSQYSIDYQEGVCSYNSCLDQYNQNQCTQNCQNYIWFDGRCVLNCLKADQEHCINQCPNYEWSPENSSCHIINICAQGQLYFVALQKCSKCSNMDQQNCSKLCQNYFFDSSINLCVPCTSKYGLYCVICNETFCLGCQYQFTPSLTYQTCADYYCRIDSCEYCSDQSSCYICFPGSKLIDDYSSDDYGKCTCDISNCILCLDSRKCAHCSETYWLSQDNKICNQGCILNCKSCNPDFIGCIECIEHYFYENSKCVPNCSYSSTANCLKCDNLNNCYECKAGYLIDILNSTCNKICDDVFCLICESISACDQCKQGYEMINGQCLHGLCQIAGCLSCESTSYCSKCYTNYNLTNGQCVPACSNVVQNCASCLDNSVCLSCQTGYTLVDSICTKACQITNCTTCLTQSKCLLCDSGFIIDETQALCKSWCTIPNCNNCKNENKCISCAPGYLPFDNGCNLVCLIGSYFDNSTKNCLPCNIQNCQNCQNISSKITCISCKDLFYLNKSDQSVTCEPCSKINNCLQCSSSTNCLICTVNYTLINGNCILATPCTSNQCQLCSKINSSCVACKGGFSLNNGVCEPIVCQGSLRLIEGECKCDYKFYRRVNSCNQCSDPNCYLCTAIACLSCVSGYFVKQNKCVECPIGCVSCNSLKICTKCESGFNLFGRLCTPKHNYIQYAQNKSQLITCPPGCKSCSVSSNKTTNKLLICDEAYYGYTIYAQKIYKCSDLCKICTLSINNFLVCLDCYSGYQLINSTCKPCVDKNAEKCSIFNVSYSVSCLMGYVARNGVCLQCDPNCLSCTIQGKTCDPGQCRQGFAQMSDSSACIPCTYNCPICSEDNPNICLSCSIRRYNNTQGICRACIDHCLTCKDGISCTLCDFGYALVQESKTCAQVQNISNCIQYSSPAKCSFCDYTFSKVNNLCVAGNSAASSCNSTSTCPYCPGGYYLASGKCKFCPVIANCKYCDPINKNICLLCQEEYYLNIATKSCVSCFKNCLYCTSSIYCTRPEDGYYLVKDSNGYATGRIAQCSFPCLTCTDFATNCLTCASSYNISGTTCESEQYYSISLILNLLDLDKTKQTSIVQLFDVYPKLRSQICILFNFKTNKSCATKVKNRKWGFGSFVYSFTVDKNDSLADPLTFLSKETIKSVNLVSVSSVIFGIKILPYYPTYLDLILGVCIPVGLLVLIILAFKYYRWRAINKELKISNLPSGTDKGIGYEI